jgi:uncharacterized protein (TIGR02001 family)
MIKSRAVLAGSLLAFAGIASADITVTPAVVSDYDFRGISQTKENPAFQLGLNYNHESGFYAGLWGSNVDFGSSKPDVEVDVFAGFAGGDAKESIGYDVGAIYYTYPSAGDLKYWEAYAGISHGWFAGKIWYSPDFGGKSTAGHTSGLYTEVNGTFPLPHDFSFVAHAGYSYGDYWDSIEYFDWSVGFTRSFGNFSASLKFIDGSDLPDGGSKVFSTDSKVWLSISTTLPWKAN